MNRTDPYVDPDVDAVVLAGGAARRLGGVDKAMLEIGGRTLLDRVLAACVGARVTTVVGPRRAVARADVRWVRERPPGGGPVAALGAGLAAGSDAAAAEPRERAAFTLVLAADLAFVTPETARRLLAAVRGADRPDGVLLVDPEGRDQPLAAVYRTAALAAALDACRDAVRGLDGAPMRAVVGRLGLARLPDLAGDSFDCDTWEALYAARSRAREDGHRGRRRGTE